VKDIHLIVWISQLGLSVLAPLCICVLGSVWLRNRLGLGVWIIFVGLALGLLGAVGSFRGCLASMRRLSENKKDPPPPTSFNKHY
jgi:hypothetical protein